MTLIGEERFAFCEQTKPLAERVLRHVFPFTVELEWTWDYDKDLDRKHGVDIVLRTNRGMSLTVQGKCLSQDFTTITCEGPGYKDSPGDWTDEKAQTDLWVYSFDGTSIERWALVKRYDLVVATTEAPLHWRRREQKTSGKSCFYWLPFSDLADRAPDSIVAFGGDWGKLANVHSKRSDLPEHQVE